MHYRFLFSRILPAVLLATGSAQAASLSFDAPGDLANFNYFNNSGSPSNQFSESTTGGVNNTGSIATADTFDQTLTFKSSIGTFNNVGDSLTTSLFFKTTATAPAAAGGKPLQLGFLNVNNNGLNSNNGIAFTSLRLVGTTASTFVYSLEAQQKVAAGTTSNSSGAIANVTLVGSEYYKLSLTITNTSNTGAGNYSISGLLQDYGATGLSVPTTKVTFPTTTLTDADLQITTLFAGFRDAGVSGVSNYDNFVATPEPAAFISLACGLSVLGLVRRRRSR